MKIPENTRINSISGRSFFKSSPFHSFVINVFLLIGFG